MAALRHDCPHEACSARQASFEFVHEFKPLGLTNELHVFLMCGVCRRAAVVVYELVEGQADFTAITFNNHFDMHKEQFKEIDFYPRPPDSEIPDHMPANVHQYFSEAVTNVTTGPNAAGAMFRKSLDVGLKYVDPDGSGNLIGRIEGAAERGLLTENLAEWAHHIRMEGNDAAHDEDPFTSDEAKDLHRFTELVMMYLFTLPGMLKERRGDPPPDDGG